MKKINLKSRRDTENHFHIFVFICVRSIKKKQTKLRNYVTEEVQEFQLFYWRFGGKKLYENQQKN